jgi:predicted PurR-regulated permease PerM
LAVLAVLYTLYFARSFLLPITFAVMLSFLLSPLVRGLRRLWIPPPLSASVTVLALVGMLGFGIYQLSGPVQAWTATAPATIASAQRRLRQLMAPLERLTRTAQQVEGSITGAPPAEDKPTEVVVAGPSAVSVVFGWGSPVLAALLEVVILLYFLLAAGDLFLEKVIRLLPQMHDKKTAVLIARQTESAISTYLITNLGINAVEGLMVFAALWAIGLPNALAWGVLAVVLEFIPYLGALVMLALLTITALSTFDDLTRILLVPGSYLLANIIQANIVTAMVLGRRLQLNPVAVLVGLAFWFWIWGVPGAFIAVPLMSVFKICCDYIEVLAPIGEFLAGPDAHRQAPERLLERTLG